jgi:predicted membrane protein
LSSFIISKISVAIFISQNFYIYFHIIKYFFATVSLFFIYQALVLPHGSNGNKKLNNAKPPNDAAHT